MPIMTAECDGRRASSPPVSAFNGVIDRVVIGGQEAWFDTIRTIAIAEPMSLTLLACGLVVGLALCRDRSRG